MEPHLDPPETSTAERVVAVVGGLALAAFCVTVSAVIVTARFDERFSEALFLRAFVAMLCGTFALLGLQPSLRAHQELRARRHLARWMARCPACGESGAPSGDCARCGHPVQDRGRRWQVHVPTPAHGFVRLGFVGAIASLGFYFCAAANASSDVGGVVLGWAGGALFCAVGLVYVVVTLIGILRTPRAVVSLVYASRWYAKDVASDTRVEVTLGDVAVARGVTRVAMMPPPRDDGEAPDDPAVRGLARLLVRVTATHRAALAFGRVVTWKARDAAPAPAGDHATEAPYRAAPLSADDGFERSERDGWLLEVRDGDLAGLLSSAGVSLGDQARAFAGAFDARHVPVAGLWAMVGAFAPFREAIAALGAGAEAFDDTRARLALRATLEAAERAPRA